MESVLKFITNSELSPDVLNATIKKTQDLNSLSALLDIKIYYMKSTSDQHKINFDIGYIYTNDTANIEFICEVLKKALWVSQDIQEPLLEINTYILKKYNDLNYKFKIVHLLNALITFCSEEDKLNILFSHLTPDRINYFLMEALLPKETKIRAYETLRYYFSVLTNAEQIKCLNAVFQFSYQNNDLDVFCAILNQVSGEAIENEGCCFNTDKFWIFLESCISGTETHLQNQGKFILLKCVQSLQNKYTNYLTVYGDIAENIENTWEAFFMLLDVGSEKQLHLVEPALDLLKYVCNLPPLWQKCIYRIYLRHSQNTIVYRIAIHILNQSYEENNLRDILKMLLPAINKNEYSELSCEMFKAFNLFCLNLNIKYFHILLEEIVQISWNPVSFWKIIQNVFISEKKMQIYVDYFLEIIRCAANLPHVYIRSECIKYLIHFFWDKKSFFKMYKIVCGLQINDINYSKYCSNFEFSQEIIDFVINELLNSNEFNDPGKARVCIMFLQNLINEILSSPINKYLNKLSPHVKLFVWDIYFHEFEDMSEQPIILYRQIEQFLIQYFIEYLHEDTTESFCQLFGGLIRAAKFSPDDAIKMIIDAVFNPDNYNKNQIYVAFGLLSQFFHLLYNENEKNRGQILIENWRHKIVEERDQRICKEYIGLIFAAYEHKFSSDNTKLTIKIFTSMFECQNNEVLDAIYERTYNLLALSESPELVIDFIDICHQNLMAIKKDQYFKAIVDKFVRIVYSPTYFFLNLKNIPLINKNLLELSEAHPIIRLNWIRAIHKLIMGGFEFFQFFLMPTLNIYLQGTIVTKEARTEYNICQEILLEDSSTSMTAYSPWKLCESSNPNLINAASRILALEVLVLLAKRDADLVTNCLREIYLTFFKKRYFPGSEIHFQKLRITQAILVLIPYVQQSVRTIRQISVFAYDCFLEEANQNCIKQLFNWILVLLLKMEGFAVIEYIRRITTFPTPASASALVGLVPAVYHLTVLGDEEAFNETIRLTLPWTMGAQFKLRVYAQDLIRRLFKHARQNGYVDFLQKYKHLEDCITSSIEATGAVFENTMKTDFVFLNDFDLIDDNSLNTILYDIPRLNNVCRTEWQNMHFYISQPDCLTENKILYEKTPLQSQNALFSDAIDAFLEKENNHIKQPEVEEFASLNIQKKITPWKTALEDVNSKIKSNFILIASLIDKPQNLGGLSRTCEVFGIRTLVLNDTKVIKDKEFRSLSMSSETWINAIEVKVKDLEGYISKCQKEGYCVVGAEQTAHSLKLNDFRFPQKTALILGNEKTGIPPKLIPLLNSCLEIPQFGQVRSLNVHVAGATFIWEYAKQHLV